MKPLNRVRAVFLREWDKTEESDDLDRIEEAWEDYRCGELTADEAIKQMQGSSTDEG